VLHPKLYSQANRFLMIEIWPFDRGRFQLFTKDIKKLAKIGRWKKVERFGFYVYPDGSIGVSILFPSSIYNRVARELGLPKKTKSVGRVEWGQTLQKSNNIAQVKSSILSSEAV